MWFNNPLQNSCPNTKSCLIRHQAKKSKINNKYQQALNVRKVNQLSLKLNRKVILNFPPLSVFRTRLPEAQHSTKRNPNAWHLACRAWSPRSRKARGYMRYSHRRRCLYTAHCSSRCLLTNSRLVCLIRRTTYGIRRNMGRISCLKYNSSYQT